jgi:hypothetical protein
MAGWMWRKVDGVLACWCGSHVGISVVVQVFSQRTEEREILKGMRRERAGRGKTVWIADGCGIR